MLMILLLLGVAQAQDVSELDPALAPLLYDVLRIAQAWEPKVRDLECLELFAGAGKIFESCLELGMTCSQYDKSYFDDDRNNILTPKGFACAFKGVLKLKPGGCFWGAPVCSCWVWICRHGTFRSFLSPEGSTAVERVRTANQMVVLFVMLCLLAWARGAHVFIEQPLTSLMPEFPPMKQFLKSCAPYAAKADMGFHGGKSASQKSLHVFSSSPKVRALACTSHHHCGKLATKDAKGRTNGHAKKLKQSQAYPKKFGKQVGKLFYQLVHQQ